MKKVTSFIDRILDKETPAERKAQEQITIIKLESYLNLMEDPTSEDSKMLAQDLLVRVAEGIITHKEASKEAMDN